MINMLQRVVEHHPATAAILENKEKDAGHFCGKLIHYWLNGKSGTEGSVEEGKDYIASIARKAVWSPVTACCHYSSTTTSSDTDFMPCRWAAALRWRLIAATGDQKNEPRQPPAPSLTVESLTESYMLQPGSALATANLRYYIKGGSGSGLPASSLTRKRKTENWRAMRVWRWWTDRRRL